MPLLDAVGILVFGLIFAGLWVRSWVRRRFRARASASSPGSPEAASARTPSLALDLSSGRLAMSLGKVEMLLASGTIRLPAELTEGEYVEVTPQSTWSRKKIL